ncbi:ABC transporter permease [Humibacter sp. BT305]|jgi:ribose transport system permease protein|uniref:ABC transporter permease n=1 Tax=Cnuibacter physcomitrellae TaxID=1619308 RepID=A0A1X9LN08_9MICO|nr:ABC transporter permease [Cnuibacter physcomitrellae]ARJ06586.1 ABC transporter permease [Cnuibacter physcomitrellae]AXH34821.1 ABC transporter permease [Humibacter sp. BT305]MCS5498078.1 ABC transporter permease [Cnuibacter physcomitrellae]GGI38355.1 ribonucleotide-diphosphate reductase subunit alpha [Cnuibacter physcomitrellae]
MSTTVAPAGPAPTAPAPESPTRRSAKRVALIVLSRYGTLIGLAIMIIAFTVRAPTTFLTLPNFLNILNQSSLTAIIAAGLTMTLVVGEFDLSIGYVASFAGLLVVGFIARDGVPVLLALPLILLIGAAIGSTNGILVTKVRINAVIATLGVGTILVGLGFAYSAFPIAAGVPQEFIQIALGRPIFGIPNPIFIMLIVLAILWVILNKTDLGQKMQAVGGNIEAARLSGIRVDRVKIFAFATAGVCAAITGTLLSSTLGSGTLAAADGYLLDAFAAVFLGSATLRDGEFHIVGTLVGVLIIAVGFNGLSIFGAPTWFQPIFKGAILVLAVGLSTLARRYAKE